MTQRRALRVLSCVFVAVLLSGLAAAQVPLNVMTFNIRYGTAKDGPNAWDLRKDVVVNAITSKQPDLLGLQECLKFQADYIAAHLPEYDHMGVGREADGTGERMEIFYKSTVVVPMQSGNFWLSETPEIPGSRSWNSANVRMATWARFRHMGTGREFMYLNSHFDHRSEDARVGAAKMLAQWASEAPAGLPVVITADFNAKAEQSLPWEILTETLEDAWQISANRVGPPVTWSSFSAPTTEIRRIDWILVTPGTTVTTCETVLYNESGRYPSDHYPVFASLNLP